MILAWIAGMVVLVQLFAMWEKKQHNPNAEPVSQVSDQLREVRLKRNAQGHFVADGRINGQRVTFLLDTGATDVAVPEHLARRLGVREGAAVQLSTANGIVTGYRGRLDSVALGSIELRDVRAVIAPGMGDDQVLLGMSFLKQLEFTQRDGMLVLRHYQNY